MKITAKRLREMQKELIRLESDIWRDLRDTEEKGIEIPISLMNDQLKARQAILDTWAALDNLIEPWD